MLILYLHLRRNYVYLHVFNVYQIDPLSTFNISPPKSIVATEWTPVSSPAVAVLTAIILGVVSLDVTATSIPATTRMDVTEEMRPQRPARGSPGSVARRPYSPV